MSIQDLIFTLGGLVFIAGLIPTLRKRSSSVPRLTSIPTTVTLLVFTANHASLGLYYSASVNFLAGVLWGLIAIYRAPKPATVPAKPLATDTVEVAVPLPPGHLHDDLAATSHMTEWTAQGELTGYR